MGFEQTSFIKKVAPSSKALWLCPSKEFRVESGDYLEPQLNLSSLVWLRETHVLIPCEPGNPEVDHRHNFSLSNCPNMVGKDKENAVL